MLSDPDHCTLCGDVLSEERVEVADLDDDRFACGSCFRRAELDAELEDALFGT